MHIHCICILPIFAGEEMKYFSIILTLIIILLIAVPCDHVSIVANSDTATITEQHHNDKENSDHLCSPFSTHDSCATMVILPEIFRGSLQPEIISTKINISYIFSYTKDFTKSFFQPPRI